MELIVEGTYLLEKFTGKGGWTFIKLPGDLIKTGKAFGMMKISGSIDNYSFEQKHLMPMGNGFVFLPIPKPIRKIIGKEEGDIVEIKLFREEIPEQPPQELIECLKDDPGKFELFCQLPITKQQEWVKYIYSTDNIELKSNRILQLLDALK